MIFPLLASESTLMLGAISMAAGFVPRDVATVTPESIATAVSGELIYKFVQLEEIFNGLPDGQVCAYAPACKRDIAIIEKVVFLEALKIFICNLSFYLIVLIYMHCSTARREALAIGFITLPVVSHHWAIHGIGIASLHIIMTLGSIDASLIVQMILLLALASVILSLRLSAVVTNLLRRHALNSTGFT